jgi:nucleoside-diphosphate kinase
MSATFEYTFALLKPDAIERGLLAPILSDFPFSPVKARLFKPFPGLWELHYHEHKGREYYARLEAQMRSGPVFGMILGGVDAINLVRQHAMALRAKYGAVGPRNIIHASDSAPSAHYEVTLWEKNL